MASVLWTEIQGIGGLDEHLWAEILRRLPVRVIGRIRCVCKSWNSLISSTFFINHHLSLVNFTASSSKYTANNKPGYLLFDPQCYWSPRVHSCMYNPDEEEPHLAEFSLLHFENLDDKDKVIYKAIGVINGIVCISRELSWSRTAGSAILWNPTIRKYLATPGDRCEGGGWVVVGFGFNARTNAFKVVRFTRPSDDCSNPLEDPPPRFEVLSTRGGGWRSVAADHIGPFLLITYRTCYKNGFIHWVLERRGGVKEVLVFDCELDEFKIMHLPRQVRTCQNISELFIRYYNSSSRRGPAGEGGGTLSLLAQRKGSGAELWVMKEYGVSSSWKKVKRPFTEDFMHIYKNARLSRLVEDAETTQLVWNPVVNKLVLNPIVNTVVLKPVVKRLHQPLNGYAFQPSLFLMDKISGDTLIN